MCAVSRTSARSEQVPRQLNCVFNYKEPDANKSHFLNLRYETRSANGHYSLVTLNKLLNQNIYKRESNAFNILAFHVPNIVITNQWDLNKLLKS